MSSSVLTQLPVSLLTCTNSCMAVESMELELSHYWQVSIAALYLSMLQYSRPLTSRQKYRADTTCGKASMNSPEDSCTQMTSCDAWVPWTQQRTRCNVQACNRCSGQTAMTQSTMMLRPASATLRCCAKAVLTWPHLFSHL